MCVTFSQFELSQLSKHLGTGYLVNATPPTILPVSFFESLQAFLSRSEDVHVIGCNIMDIIYDN